jgi:hypothetical protein
LGLISAAVNLGIRTLRIDEHRDPLFSRRVGSIATFGLYTSSKNCAASGWRSVFNDLLINPIRPISSKKYRIDKITLPRSLELVAAFL